MERLAEKITERLVTHKSCVVFENELSRIWPCEDKERQRRHAAIHAFAQAHGWSATVLDPGIRVTFRKLKEGEKSESARQLARVS